MAEVVRTNVVTPVNVLAVQQHSITGLTAGEDLESGDAVYIASADGRVYKAIGVDEDETSRCCGFVAKIASEGEPCTILVRGVHLAYGGTAAGEALVAGSHLYVSAAVPGGLVDDASEGGSVPVAYVIDYSGRIMVIAG